MKRYTPPTRYTAEELANAELADLETDLRCAERDGLHAYAAELEAKIVYMRARMNPVPRFDGRCGVCNSNAHATADCPPKVRS